MITIRPEDKNYWGIEQLLHLEAKRITAKVEFNLKDGEILSIHRTDIKNKPKGQAVDPKVNQQINTELKKQLQKTEVKNGEAKN